MRQGQRTSSQRYRRRRRRRAARRFLWGLFLGVFLFCLFWGLRSGESILKRPAAVSLDALRNGEWTSILQNESDPSDAEQIGAEVIGLELRTGEGDIREELSELLEKNAEARAFVENYENRASYLGQEIDLSGELQDGQVPLLMQWDLRWGYEAYGDSLLGLSGCGPACLSMVYLYYTGDPWGNPKNIAAFCEEQGYYTREGTSWKLWTEGVEQLGLSGRELSLDERKMREALDEGCLIVCSMRPGDFTTTGHYILLWDYGESGFSVKDPNRAGNSEKTWSYDVLQGQIKNLWAINAL